MATFGNEIKQKLSKTYCCEICHYNTDRKSNMNNHNLSAKHQTATTSHSFQQKLSKNFCCENCDKTYKDRTGLWKHKKICNSKITPDLFLSEENDIKALTNLVLDVVKQNQELTNKLVDICKTNSISNTNFSNNNINSNNKSFNLNFFLNETCKDAMNIMDFVDSIKLQLCDLESVGQLGYIEGISNIIVKNLNSLDETKRPVHCADSKREVMYVKDDNKWEKENVEKSKLRNAIKCVSRKNSKLLKDFRVQYPGCDKSDSKLSTKYDKLTLEAFGGKGDDYEGKEDKIIRNIAKNVIIDKINYIE
jgi:hypothetical protein